MEKGKRTKTAFVIDKDGFIESTRPYAKEPETCLIGLSRKAAQELKDVLSKEIEKEGIKGYESVPAYCLRRVHAQLASKLRNSSSDEIEIKVNPFQNGVLGYTVLSCSNNGTRLVETYNAIKRVWDSY
ncbi:MAG: hypothetical protein KGH66_00425 [Candidatus Micrarchaeota archaeon]|nr:hypothetical protein [Candidatus Micrarchaeota archaeon]